MPGRRDARTGRRAGGSGDRTGARRAGRRRAVRARPRAARARRALARAARGLRAALPARYGDVERARLLPRDSCAEDLECAVDRRHVAGRQTSARGRGSAKRLTADLGRQAVSGAVSSAIGTISPLAGKPAPKDILVDPARLEHEYYARTPDPADPTQRVSFGTSGHRGSPLSGSFTEAHIAAITQAICDYRRRQRTDGPLYMGKDTHAVSEPAQRTALEVLAANGVDTIIQRDHGVTPTPVISRAILVYNRDRHDHLADGIVVTPSHNPPQDGGFKYNPPHGGPAHTETTRWIEERANGLLRDGNVDVKRVPFAWAIRAATTHEDDLVLPTSSISNTWWTWRRSGAPG